jgi:hypothetical protein
VRIHSLPWAWTRCPWLKPGIFACECGIQWSCRAVVATRYIVLYGEDSVRPFLKILWLLALAIAAGVCTAAPYTGLTRSLVACESDQCLLRLWSYCNLPHVWCDFWQAEQALLAFFLRGLEASAVFAVGAPVLCAIWEWYDVAIVRVLLQWR